MIFPYPAGAETRIIDWWRAASNRSLTLPVVRGPRAMRAGAVWCAAGKWGGVPIPIVYLQKVNAVVVGF
jgi:hypothetical protein